MLFFLDNKEINFISWIKKNFFTPEEGFPIFGPVLKVHKPLDRSQFGDIQISLIRYLSDPCSYRFLHKLPIGLIGCWLKTYYPHQWIIVFNNDDLFAIFMRDLLNVEEKFKALFEKKNS
jgi:hypothetical protein